MRRSSATELGAKLVAALAERNFERLADTFAPDVRMRALIPPGPVKVSGAEAAASRYESWFGRFAELRLVRSDVYDVGDRVHVSYRFHAKEPDDAWKIVEQHVFCTLDDGHIAAFDLLCSGFRPDGVNADDSNSA